MVPSLGKVVFPTRLILEVISIYDTSVQFIIFVCRNSIRSSLVISIHSFHGGDRVEEENISLEGSGREIVLRSKSFLRWSPRL